MSSRKVTIVQDTSSNAIQLQPITTLAKIPRKGCCGCCRETEEERYESVLETAIIDEHFKNSIRRRYIHLLNEFQIRAFHYSLLYHIGHLIITVGSLIVPALLSVQYTNSLAAYQTNIYWLTWTLSLLVTTFNGVLVLFKVDKKYHSLHTTLERLRSEGWQFLELTGRYAGHLLHTGDEASHKNQYRFFCHYVEKIKLAQIEEEYYKYEDTNNPLSHAPSSQKLGIKESGIVLPSINEEISGLSPPQSVKEVMQRLITETDVIPSPKNEVINILPSK
jgi:Protein of unknown function (DUF4231)